MDITASCLLHRGCSVRYALCVKLAQRAIDETNRKFRLTGLRLDVHDTAIAAIETKSDFGLRGRICLEADVAALEELGEVKAVQPDHLFAAARIGLPPQFEQQRILEKRHAAMIVLLIVVAEDPSAALANRALVNSFHQSADGLQWEFVFCHDGGPELRSRASLILAALHEKDGASDGACGESPERLDELDGSNVTGGESDDSGLASTRDGSNDLPRTAGENAREHLRVNAAQCALLIADNARVSQYEIYTDAIAI